MRSNVDTLLSLLEWCELSQTHPWYFAQISKQATGSSALFPRVDTGDCDHPFFQYPWQSHGYMSRDEIGEAIANAEQNFYEVMKFWPAPKWFTGEQHQYPQPAQMNVNAGYRRSRGHFRFIEVHNKYVQQTGTQTLTLIDDDVALTLSDKDGDGINDTFTIDAALTVPTGTTLDQIKVFASETYRMGEPLAQFQIWPLQMALTGTSLTIRGRAYQLIKPTLQEIAVPEGLEHDTAANYMTTIAVYRETASTTTGSLIWENPNCDTAPCVLEIETGCFTLSNKPLGLIAPIPATYDADTAAWAYNYPEVQNRAPDKIVANYQAGYGRMTNGRMDRTMARVIFYLSCAEMPRLPFACKRTKERIEWLRQIPGDGASFSISQDIFNTNPFGGTLGELKAWQLLYKRDEMGDGALA